MTTAKHLALITGGSRGIGAAIAEELAGAGCAVLLNYRADAAGAQSVKARLETTGASVTLLPFDVRDAAATQAALAPWLDGGPTIDIIVNNAGISRDNAFPSMPASDWRW